MSRVGWVDAGLGASGDMLLGALAGVGADVAGPVAALGLDVSVELATVRRAGLAATRAHVRLGPSPQPVRTLPAVTALLTSSSLHDGVTAQAIAVFTMLAEAEADVHGSTLQEVHFHEVGALDSLADVVGVLGGLASLGLDELTCSPPALGSGTVGGAHGVLGVPVPAVVEIMRRTGMPSAPEPYPAAGELLTPTAAALLAVCAAGFGPMPAMSVEQVGVGAGGRDPAAAPNVTRLVVGSPVGAGGHGPPRLLECTVDDLDPRLWPAVLDALLAAGALDTWLTPVLMKKGRPGHVLSALAAPGQLDAVRAAMLSQTSTLGLREIALAHRPALERTIVTVQLDGHPVRVKLGWAPGGTVQTATPEWEDVAALARALGQPPRLVLARASAQASALLGSLPAGGEPLE